MKMTKPILAAALLVPALLLTLPAVASKDDDDYRKSTAAAGDRLPITAVLQKVEEAGYTDLREVELEGGVYEVEAMDKKGRPFEIKIDAITGEILDIEQE